MKKILTIILLMLFICGCNNKNKNEMNLEKIMSENEYIILDVRTNTEYEQIHIEGAINIPHNEIDENIELDKNKTILVYCQSGNRSSIAFNILTELGYTVYDLGSISTINLPKE